MQNSFEPGQTDNREISLYGHGKVSPTALAHGIALIKRAFPKLVIGWYKVLEDMIDEEGFTDERFRDAIKNLIKTCPYPEPTIANVLGYDKKIKIFNHYELMEKHKTDFYPGTKFDLRNFYEAINISGQLRYVRKEDFSEAFIKWDTKRGNL